jgi:co-chaperonin GroES (HSP10)
VTVEQSGVRVTRKTTDFVANLRPLRDWLVVKPEPPKITSTLEVIERTGETVRGVVVSAGPGTYPWKYNADRSKRWASKVFVPTQVKPGDTVELGGWEINGYSFPTVMMNGEACFLCQEQDICGIVEGV